VCLRNISINTLHKGDDDGDDKSRTNLSPALKARKQTNEEETNAWTILPVPAKTISR